MTFNSWEFLLFFPIVCALFFVLPQAFRWILLLAASYFFYMYWKPEYIILIVISTVIDYFAVKIMLGSQNPRIRKLCLIASLTSNLGILFTFKYFNFFLGSLELVMDTTLKEHRLDVLLPVGISFYTFQTLSYTIDAYRGKLKAENHFGIFAVYVAYFPQLVAGPIERAERLLPQFYKKVQFDYQRVVEGLRLILWGMFKKVVIADRLAIFVDQVFQDPSTQTAPMLLMGSFFFAYQIFCDFSGYSDIAIGSARVMGINLMDNFNKPYHARGFSDFWNRWHISLSSWFRDYLYIPLGGNRTGKFRTYFNLMTVFLVSGLWHGANWTYVVWGGLHGFYLICGRFTASWQKRFYSAEFFRRIPFAKVFLQIFITFFLTCIAWVFFRAQSVDQAFTILQTIFTDLSSYREFFGNWREILRVNDISMNLLGLSFILIIFLEIVHLIQKEEKKIIYFIDSQPIWIRWAIMLGLIFLIMNFGVIEQKQFIYFQF